MITRTVVTADFDRPDGSAPAGTVTFSLTGTLRDPATSETVDPGTVVATVSGSGSIAQPVAATDDAGIEPTTRQYYVTVALLGAPTRSFYMTVPHAPPGSRAVADAVATNGSPTVTSATAAFTGADVGKYVFCPAFPSGAQIVSVTNSTTAVLNASAFQSGTGLAFVVGAQVDLSSVDEG